MADSDFGAPGGRNCALASLVRGKKGGTGRDTFIYVLFERITCSLYWHSCCANALVWVAQADARRVPFDSRRRLFPGSMGACDLRPSLASDALFSRSRVCVGKHDKRSGGTF